MCMELFRKRLEQTIKESGRSQSDIEDASGIGFETLYRWRKIIKVLPSAQLLADFCKEMHVSMDWLCGLSDRKEII